MSKKFFTKLLMSLAWLAAAVLWLLSELKPDTFGFFNLNWAIVVICGTGGLAFMLRGLVAKKTGVLKKSDIFLGALLLVIAAVSVIFALSQPWQASFRCSPSAAKNGMRATIKRRDIKITTPEKENKRLWKKKKTEKKINRLGLSPELPEKKTNPLVN